jgi:hypothetical protein
VVLEVEFALDDAGRSAPLRYGELAAALGVAVGDRADPAQVRATVLALRAGKGMVLDDADHDTWSVGSFFTNPVVPVEQFDRLQAGREIPVPLPGPRRVKLAAGWLVEQAGFGKGYPGADGAACRLSTKHALALTNRGAATTADVWRSRGRCGTASATCSASPGTRTCAGRLRALGPSLRPLRRSQAVDVSVRHGDSAITGERTSGSAGGNVACDRPRDAPAVPPSGFADPFRLSLIDVSPANDPPSVNRRRALAALGLGVVAPGALAACFGGPGGQSGQAGPRPSRR